jgi:hypothetical protein
MARIEAGVHVPMRIADVFAFLNKRESHRRFIPRMTELRQTSQGDFGQAGTTLAGTLNYFGMRIPVQYEIIEVTPDQSLAMNGRMGPIDFTDGYTLRKNGDGTELRFWLDLRPTGWARAFSPVMGLIGRIHAWETLRNLKRELAKIGG